MNIELGRRGEDLAAAFLRKQLHRILARNYRTPHGEIDLITHDDASGTLCFVEVKTRRSDAHTPGEHAVNAGKRKRLRAAAKTYLVANNIHHLPTRFDIVAIVITATDATPFIRHHPDCF